MPRLRTHRNKFQIRSSLKLCAGSAELCAGEPGWYEPFWRLILIENNSPQDIGVMEAELVQVVIEIIFIVMWKGVKGSDHAAWVVRSYFIILSFSQLRLDQTKTVVSYWNTHFFL